MISCLEDGLTWTTNNTTGGFFMFLHTFIMIGAAIQVERVFYKVLIETSFFDGDLPITNEVVDCVMKFKKSVDIEMSEANVVFN